jgi:hypothetical protein
MRILEVILHDAHADSETWTARDLSGIDDGPLVVRSVGYELKPGKKNHIVLAQSATDDHVDHVLMIPKGMVQRVVVLRK